MATVTYFEGNNSINQINIKGLIYKSKSGCNLKIG